MASSVNSIVSQLLSSDAVKQIAKKSGVDASGVSSILASALPELLSGASKQANTKSTLAGFAEALASHSSNDTSNLTSFFKNVDAEDGAKIISHLLGNKTTTVENKVAKTSSIDAGDVAKVLAVAAPLVMSLLGQQANKQTNKTTGIADVVGGLLGNEEIASVASSLLGAATGSKTSSKKDASIDLGDVINIASKFIK